MSPTASIRRSPRFHWILLSRLPGLQVEARSISVRGNVACVFSFGACRFYQLDPMAPPRLMGQCFLSRSSQVLFDGRRIASISEDATIGLQIFEATDASLSRWRLVKNFPGAKQLAAIGWRPTGAALRREWSHHSDVFPHP